MREGTTAAWLGGMRRPAGVRSRQAAPCACAATAVMGAADPSTAAGVTSSALMHSPLR